MLRNQGNGQCTYPLLKRISVTATEPNASTPLDCDESAPIQGPIYSRVGPDFSVSAMP
jgi:hypothetical protein